MISYHDDLSTALRIRKQDYGGAPTSLEYKSNELGGEIGEAFEAFLELGAAGGRAQNIAKKLVRERLKMKGGRADPNDLRLELGDIIICVQLIADMFGWDMKQTVAEKFNITSDKIGSGVRMVVK